MSIRDETKPQLGIDMTILDRISEADVEQWMTARLLRLRAEGRLHRYMTLSVWYWECDTPPQYETSWTVFGCGKHGSGPTIEFADAAVTNHLLHKARIDANKARREAARLLEQADALDKWTPPSPGGAA